MAAVTIGALLFFLSRERTDTEAPVEAPKDLEFYSFDKTVCPGETRKLKMNDVYLRGILEQGSEFNVVINWYACNSPKRGELALYRYSHKALPVVGLIAAIGGDQVKLIKNADLNAWTITVNGKAIMSEGRPYFIGVAQFF